MRIIKLLLLILLVIVVVVMSLLFMVENNMAMTVDLFIFDLTLSSGSWVVLSFVVGAVAGLAAAAGVFVRMYGRQAQLRRKVLKLERTLDKLRRSTSKGW
ncbi:hypothetical protein SIN8267_00852 [Sinobacterium norvegicum]|uniref:Lipopolysaccharide assembly protein A domain-containing protein n=1 Tax=Sinobacterium norvegicum TaxID=1641715 RepID=A0ABM9AC31_9GAMM|nr:lipopolysaccharide assembly protein LapA domain-containing protein [Sinobacterium norvegicum]CAH0990753.1 hypothetical protein SIN8267_00852 [Sinobacterium norvegicum]